MVTFMQPEFTQHSELINAKASDWFTLMQSDSVTEQQRQQLQHWLDASHEHQDAYQQLAVIWDDLAVLSTLPQAKALKQSATEVFSALFLGKFKISTDNFFTSLLAGLYPKISLAICSAAAAVLVTMFYLVQPGSVSVDSYTTAIGEIKKITLTDGSEITLGAKSTIKVWANDVERHVILVQGQAFFAVTQDPQRPFWVEAYDTRVKVIGTKFDVRASHDRIRVAVLEGVVNVSSMATASEQTVAKLESRENKSVVLTAGQQVIKSRTDKFKPVETISELELGAWREGRLYYRNANLEDVIADANRYFNGDIRLATTELALMKVTLALRIDQVNFLPDMLSETLPIVIHKESANQIVISGQTENL